MNKWDHDAANRCVYTFIQLNVLTHWFYSLESKQEKTKKSYSFLSFPSNTWYSDPFLCTDWLSQEWKPSPVHNSCHGCGHRGFFLFCRNELVGENLWSDIFPQDYALTTSIGELVSCPRLTLAAHVDKKIIPPYKVCQYNLIYIALNCREIQRTLMWL